MHIKQCMFGFMARSEFEVAPITDP